MWAFGNLAGERLTTASRSSRNPLPNRGSNSVVECHLAKVDVAGSTPVSRST